MKKPSKLSEEIGRLEDLISDLDPVDKEYKTVSKRLAELSDIRNKNEPSSRFEVDGNTITLVAANILGIILVLKHEQFNAVSSKALGFIVKLKP